MREFLDYLPPRLARIRQDRDAEPHLQGAHQGHRRLHADEAIEWGVTGPSLRACGFDWDFRKKRPYSRLRAVRVRHPDRRSTATATTARVVRVEEMRQSLRIIQQCVEHMPAGPYKSHHPLTTPPLKERTMHDIETLITHFLERELGAGDPAGRGVRRHRSDQGQQRLLPGQRRRDTRLSRAHPHAVVSASADAAAAVPRALRWPICSPSWAASISCWRTWTDDAERMLSEKNGGDRRGAAALPRPARRVRRGAQDRAAQPRLGLRRDAARARRAPRHDADELDGVATFYNMIFRRPVGRHVIFLCDSVSCWIMGYEALRAQLQAAARHRLRRDHAPTARFTLLPDRLSRRLRPRAGADARRRAPRRRRPRRSSTRSSDQRELTADGTSAHRSICAATARRSTSKEYEQAGGYRALAQGAARARRPPSVTGDGQGVEPARARRRGLSRRA